MSQSYNRLNRKNNELRKINIITNYIPHAEGSCLIEFGNTRVICTATVEEKVPFFLKNTGRGWVTAEYGMLPRSTHTRNQRDTAKGGPNGRAQEIQRLIGRSLRAAVDLNALQERQITIDCDVLQADGGTRTAAITGGFVALYQALAGLYKSRKIYTMPVKFFIAGVSCAIVSGSSLLDVDFAEDSRAEVDANFVMNSEGMVIEVQSVGENGTFSEAQLAEMMHLARDGIAELIALQKQALEIK